MRMGKAPGLKLQAAIVQDNVPIEVAPGLFVGSIHAAFNVDALKAKKITHILNLAGAYATFPGDFAYLSVSIRDKDYANLLSCLPVATLFLQAGIDAGGVLVHCAGGRSRSPAVAIAYLMLKDKLSFESAAEHVRTLRPVVSLNTGFEAQLRCLERARGDVFDAHQLHLQSKLSTLAERRADGTLALESHRRQHRPSSQSQQHKQRQHAAIPGTPPHPSMSIRALQLERQAAAGCDDRGMLDGTLPSGFCLSLPLTASATPQFVPALRSMGSRFGCRSCGEHLFCASAVVQHSAASHLNLSSVEGIRSPVASPPTRKAPQDAWSFVDEPTEEVETNSLDSSDDAPVSEPPPMIDTSVLAPPPPPPPSGSDTTPKRATKKPLLAKLRLRPQSPSVSSPTGSDKSTPRAVASSTPTTVNDAQASASGGTPTSCRSDKSCASDGQSDATRPTGVLKSLKKDKPKHPDARCEKRDDCAVKSHSGSSSSGHASKSSDKFWRTLTALTATKRMFKDSSGSSKQHHHFSPTGSSGATGADEKKRANGVADGAASLYDVPPLLDAAVLRQNELAWERGLRTLECASDDGHMALVTDLIAADARALATLACDEWFIEPQTWFLDAVIQSQSGAIRCPNSACSAVVGQWRWDGLSCSCGGRVCPGIQMKKSALQPLGSVLAQVRKGADESAPENADALYRQHS